MKKNLLFNRVKNTNIVSHIKKFNTSKNMFIKIYVCDNVLLVFISFFDKDGMVDNN